MKAVDFIRKFGWEYAKHILNDDDPLVLDLNYVDLKTYVDAWEAGAQSRQAEIDELQKNFNNTLKTIEVQQKFLDDADGANKFLTNQVDELQKRINQLEQEKLDQANKLDKIFYGEVK